MENESNLLLTVKDVITETGLSRDKVYSLMRCTSFPAIQIGRSYYVTRDNLRKFLDLYKNRRIDITTNGGIHGKGRKD